MAAKKGYVRGDSVHDVSGGQDWHVEGDFRPFQHMNVEYVLVPDVRAKTVGGGRESNMLYMARITRVLGPKAGSR